jgi:hypothetical protein
MPVQPLRVPAPARGTDSGRALTSSQVQTLLAELANLHGVVAVMTARLADLNGYGDARSQTRDGSTPIAVPAPAVLAPALGVAVGCGRHGGSHQPAFMPLLRQFRIRLGLTQEQAAERIIELARIHERVELPATAHTVSRHERGVRFPTPIYRRQYRRLYAATDQQLGLVNPPLPATPAGSAG